MQTYTVSPYITRLRESTLWGKTFFQLTSPFSKLEEVAPFCVPYTDGVVCPTLTVPYPHLYETAVWGNHLSTNICVIMLEMFQIYMWGDVESHRHSILQRDMWRKHSAPKSCLTNKNLKKDADVHCAAYSAR